MASSRPGGNSSSTASPSKKNPPPPPPRPRGAHPGRGVWPDPEALPQPPPLARAGGRGGGLRRVVERQGAGEDHRHEQAGGPRVRAAELAQDADAADVAVVQVVPQAALDRAGPLRERL